MADFIIKPTAGTGNSLELQNEAGNVVFSTNNGTANSTWGAVAPPMKRNEGLVVKYVSATTVDIDADFLTVFDSNSVGIVLSSVNLTADITASGVNGLDTGAEAAVWYHIYVIYNGTTVASLLSASATSPTMPSGYTYKKYVGAVYNRSSSFSNFYQGGNDVIFPKDDTWNRVVANGTATSFTLIDGVNSDTKALSAVIPTTANVIIGYYGVIESSGTRALGYIAATAAGMGQLMLEVQGASGSITSHQNFDLVLVETQAMYYYRHSSLGDDIDVYVTGYKFSGIV